MLNQVMLVGRLVEDPKVKKSDDGKQVGNMAIVLSRPFKNSNGEYESDIINIDLFNDIAEKTSEYCKKNDVVGIKGRLSTNGNKISVIADKVTFLSSKLSKTDDKEIEKDINV